jgi:hypothetical protein
VLVIIIIYSLVLSIHVLNNNCNRILTYVEEGRAKDEALFLCECSPSARHSFLTSLFLPDMGDDSSILLGVKW